MAWPLKIVSGIKPLRWRLNGRADVEGRGPQGQVAAELGVWVDLHRATANGAPHCTVHGASCVIYEGGGRRSPYVGSSSGSHAADP